MVNASVDAVDKGKRAENGFKKEAWKSVNDAISKEFPSITFTMKSIKSKETEMKNAFWEFQNC